MLEEVLRYVNNRFERNAWDGTFSVAGGVLDADGILEGQYYWVEGSVLNDGLHLHPAGDLRDEKWDGRIVALAVPRAVAELADEISQWCEANAQALASPYQSESFGGYSYTKASAAQGAETPAAAWQLHFGARLRPYRKLARDWV